MGQSGPTRAGDLIQCYFLGTKTRCLSFFFKYDYCHLRNAIDLEGDIHLHTQINTQE